MHLTKIGIFKIAQTRVNWPQVAEWLNFIGVKDVENVLGQIATRSLAQVTTIAGNVPPDQLPATDASALIALCGKRCYNSFEPGLNPNVSKIRADHAEYVTNILKSGHGSVLEHATWSFAIENISRVFTGEQNRHRAGVAISEASMRYIRFDDIGFTMPSSLEPSDEEIEAAGNEYAADLLQSKKQKELTEDIFMQAFSTAEKFYIDLCNIWKIEEMTDFTAKKKLTSMFRRIIGMGVSTGGIWTVNARAMRHIIAMRASEHAEEEMQDVWGPIIEQVIQDEPLLFGDFTKNDKGSWVPKYPKV